MRAELMLCFFIKTPPVLLCFQWFPIWLRRETFCICRTKSIQSCPKEEALDLKDRVNQQSTLATGGWVAERPKTYMNLYLLVPIMWKVSVAQENNPGSGFSGSFWLHPLQLLPSDGTRGTEAGWEVVLAEGRARHKITITHSSYME